MISHCRGINLNFAHARDITFELQLKRQQLRINNLIDDCFWYHISVPRSSGV